MHESVTTLKGHCERRFSGLSVGNVLKMKRQTLGKSENPERMRVFQNMPKTCLVMGQRANYAWKVTL